MNAFAQVVVIHCVAFLWRFGAANEVPTFNSTEHVDFIANKFYNIYYYAVNDTILDRYDISKTESPNANLSDSDDWPEMRINLPFDFKFYGHLHDWIAVSPNGFLTTHPEHCTGFFCNWNAEMTGGYRRYIAPVMTDFDMSASSDSNVYIKVTNRSITVRWENATLWEPSATPAADSLQHYKFTTQAAILADGEIWFSYYSAPVIPSTLSIPLYPRFNYTFHTGVEDAGYVHEDDGYYRLRPYEPYPVNSSMILSRHFVRFVPNPTCIDQLSCPDCRNLKNDPGTDLDCGWCPSLRICTDGVGREISELADGTCTGTEVITNLNTPICNFLDLPGTNRPCEENTRVMAKYPPYDEVPESGMYYSGVIVGMKHENGKYQVKYDSDSLQTQWVFYEFVHPCYTVAWDYSSTDLPGLCAWECQEPRESERSEESGDGSSGGSGISAGLIAVIVICVILALIVLLFCGRFCIAKHFMNRRASDYEHENIDLHSMEMPTQSVPTDVSAFSQKDGIIQDSGHGMYDFSPIVPADAPPTEEEKAPDDEEAPPAYPTLPSQDDGEQFEQFGEESVSHVPDAASQGEADLQAQMIGKARLI